MSNATSKATEANPDAYRVVYLGAHAYRAYYGPSAVQLDAALTMFRQLKRQGRTAWIETEAGAFFPVAGARRKPAEATPAV